MVSCLIGKEHRGLSKSCGVTGLVPSVSDVQFMDHKNFLESITSEIHLENMKSAGERAKCLMHKEYVVVSDV